MQTMAIHYSYLHQLKTLQFKEHLSVYSKACADLKKNVKALHNWPIVWEMHQWMVGPQHKGQLCGMYFHAKTSSWFLVMYCIFALVYSTAENAYRLLR